MREIMNRIIKALLIIPLVLVLTSSCGSNDKIPENVLSHEKMVDVMVDVQLAEAILRDKRLSGDDIEKMTNDYYRKVFEKHNITPQKFDTSFAYYEKHIEKFDEVYRDMLVKLNKMQREAEQERKNAHKNKDGE